MTTLEFAAVRASVAQAVKQAEQARALRIESIDRQLPTLEADLMTKQQEVAALRAERERLQAQTGAQIVARMVGEGGEKREQKQDEPFIPGLPDKRLREVWAEWEDKEGDVATFKGERYRYSSWPSSDADQLIGDGSEWSIALRPHGKTRAEVEAMADAAERKPALLDLRGLKVGTTVLFEADAIGGAGGGVVKKGYSVAIKAMSGAGVLVTWHDGLWERWIAPLQPARVVEVPR